MRTLIAALQITSLGVVLGGHLAVAQVPAAGSAPVAPKFQLPPGVPDSPESRACVAAAQQQLTACYGSIVAAQTQGIQPPDCSKIAPQVYNSCTKQVADQQKQSLMASKAPASGVAPAPAASSACGGIANTKLAPGQALNVNAPITSPNGRFKLVYQTDGNLVVYTGNTPVWASGKQSPPGRAIMQTDGNFVTYDASNRPTWASATSFQHPGAWLAMQDDGNVVVYDNNSCKPLWASK